MTQQPEPTNPLSRPVGELGADLEPAPAFGESMELLVRARDGDRAALDDLLARYQDRLWRIARIRLGSDLRRHMDSGDVVNRALFVAAGKLPEFEPRATGSLMRWLETILVRQIHDARDHLEAQKRDRRRTTSLEGGSAATDDRPPGIEPESPATSPPVAAARAELRELFDACVADLDHDHREAILLRDYHGGSWEWIAEQLGRPTPHAAEQLYQRARLKLGRLLQRRMRDADG